MCNIGGMRLNVEIKDQIYKRVAAQAQAQGRSMSDVVRVLLLKWLGWQPGKAESENARVCDEEGDG